MPSIILSDNGVSSGSAGLKTTAASDGALVLQTSTSGGAATTAVTIDTNQNVTFANRTTNPTTISVGGATPSTSGAGITFPATQSASSDANTLDDYEEGTWTPTLSRGGASFTYVGQYGTYTKIGNLVFVAGFIQWSSNSGGSGAYLIANLPFTVGNLNVQYYPVANVTDMAGITYPASTTSLNIEFSRNSTTAVFIGNGSGVSSSPLVTFGSGGNFYFSGSYQIS
jgi:hypothetical protein